MDPARAGRVVRASAIPVGQQGSGVTCSASIRVVSSRRTVTPAMSTPSTSRDHANSLTTGRSSDRRLRLRTGRQRRHGRVVGDSPCTVFIVIRGVMEYLDDHGEVVQRDSTETLRETYLRYCEANGFEGVDLDGSAPDSSIRLDATDSSEHPTPTVDIGWSERVCRCSASKPRRACASAPACVRPARRSWQTALA